MPDALPRRDARPGRPARAVGISAQEWRGAAEQSAAAAAAQPSTALWQRRSGLVCCHCRCCCRCAHNCTCRRATCQMVRAAPWPASPQRGARVYV